MQFTSFSRVTPLVLASVLACTVTVGWLAAPLPVEAKTLRGGVSYSMQQANKLFELGRYKEAEAHYTQALKANPGNIQAKSGLAVVQAELYKLGAAEKNAQEVLRKTPNNAHAHMALGLVNFYRSTSSDMTHRSQSTALLENAVSEYKMALNSQPNNPDIHNRLGEIYREQGDMALASEAFTRAIELDPKYSEAYSNKGSVLREMGRTDDAIRHYQQAIKLNKENYKAYMRMGEALGDQGKYHEAYEALNVALYKYKDSAASHTVMGKVLAKQGNDSAAISNFRKAIQANPNYVLAYQELANVFDRRGDGEFAIAELKSALNTNRNLETLKLDVARLSLQDNKVDQAIQYYQDVLKNNPNNPDALKGLSNAYIRDAENTSSRGILGGSDKYVDAEIAIQKALQNNPNDPSLHLAMMRVNRLSGKPQEARQHFQAIVNTPPRSEADQLAIGEALFSLGRYQDADRQHQYVLNQYSYDPNKQLLVADSLNTMGDVVMAERAYQQILQAHPDNLKAQRGLQRVDKTKHDAQKTANLGNAMNNWYSKKQRQSALDFYEESVSIHQRQPDLRYKLAKLYDHNEEYGKAIIEYEAYLDLSPELTEGKRKAIQDEIRGLQAKMAKAGTPNTTTATGPGGIVTPAYQPTAPYAAPATGNTAAAYTTPYSAVKY